MAPIPEPGGSPVEAFLLRKGHRTDARSAALLHSAQISEGFLAYLGPRFLSRLYSRVAIAPGSFLLVAEADREVVGFIAGTFDTKSLYKQFLLRDGAVSAVASAPRLLRALPRVLETLRHGSGSADDGTPCELLAVAVDPSWRGRGVGTHLVEGFLDQMRRGGADAAKVVVGASNLTAVAMYERSGFERTQSFELHPGTTSLVMTWTAS